MTKNSLSPTSSDTLSSAVTGVPCRDVNRNATLSMRSFGAGATYITWSLSPAACFTKRNGPSKSKFM